MKRKLNEDLVPTPVDNSGSKSPVSSFQTLGLDPRLLQAIASEGFGAPTEVQSKAIPLILENRDLLCRSKTGSGKTAAYVLPAVESVLRRKSLVHRDASTQRNPAILILVPTRELAQQVSKTIAAFSSFCSKDVRILNLVQKIPESVQRSLLAEFPDIVVATPARAVLNLGTSALSLNNLSQLVIDEADLVLSYGYDEDLRSIRKAIPTGIQTVLMSATLTTEVEAVEELFCRNPAILELDDRNARDGGITQYVVRCAEDEKFLLAFVIFKLKLVKGKCITFVADIDRCYRLKLFLEQFGVRSCVLNSELPVNSRIHVVEEYNKNVYDIIIASDELEIIGDEQYPSPTEGDQSSSSAQNVNGASIGESSIEPPAEEPSQHPIPKKRKASKTKSKEYGISRGIDFKNVACVLNFDLPTTAKSYTHRIGRTARAGQTGMALSFVIPRTNHRKHKPTSVPSTKHDEEVLTKIISHQSKKGKEVKPYTFDMQQVDAFRYRTNDALRAVTPVAIRAARTRELRQELIKSEKLKRHFEENPDDLRHLRHDGELRSVRVQPHLRHVPEYLMPGGGNKVAGEGVGFVGLRKETENRVRKARMRKGVGRGKGRKKDPLRTFRAKGR